MKVGGYRIIDLKGTNFTVGTGVVIDGIYDKIESTRKPLYVSGVVVAGVEYHDTWVDFTVDGSNYKGTIYGYTIVVQNNDVVTLKNV